MTFYHSHYQRCQFSTIYTFEICLQHNYYDNYNDKNDKAKVFTILVPDLPILLRDHTSVSVTGSGLNLYIKIKVYSRDEVDDIL